MRPLAILSLSCARPGSCRCAHGLVATRHRVLLSRYITLCRDMGILPMGKLYRDIEMLYRDRKPQAQPNLSRQRKVMLRHFLWLKTGIYVVTQGKTMSRHRARRLCRDQELRVATQKHLFPAKTCRYRGPLLRQRARKLCCDREFFVVTQTWKLAVAFPSLFCTYKLFFFSFILNTLNSIHNSLFITRQSRDLENLAKLH